jgi:uncharacterized protein (DUF924 family)
MSQSEAVLEFWFGAAAEPAPSSARMQRWFGGSEDFDREIRERFGAVLLQARSGALTDWAETARGRLALIVVLDQFSRNVYRGSAEAFSKDALGLELAQAGIEIGHYERLSPLEQLFFVLPFEHAEDLAAQERAVALYEAWAKSLPPTLEGLGKHVLDFARMHRDVIARFGRFPTRNQALGRSSTPEEEAHVSRAKSAGHPV